jgi:hypothetical protein
MTKDNENIHFHIIDEDYRAKRKIQNSHFESSGKALLLTDLKKDGVVIEQLNRMHGNFAAPKSRKPLKRDENSDQVEQQNSDESMNFVEVSKLFASYQKLRKREQGLIDCKQELCAVEVSLRDRLTQEIERKKKNIEELCHEILALQDICKEIEQELGPSMLPSE